MLTSRKEKVGIKLEVLKSKLKGHYPKINLNLFLNTVLGLDTVSLNNYRMFTLNKQLPVSIAIANKMTNVISVVIKWVNVLYSHVDGFV